MRNHFVHKLTLTALLGVFALGTLAACGIKGDLKTPPPIWGDKSQTDKTKAEKSKQEPSKP
ncbi:MAG: argininosuccinate lyase [Robiginitomaculum sp.]|nr:MAG: argininosuccinate lyase [Robiginitomaculum sp.]